MTGKILVIGGTGMLGKPVAMQLKKDNFHVTIMSRNPNDARIKMPGSFEIIKGDVFDKELLDDTLKYFDAIHINLNDGPSGKKYAQTEKTGTENIVQSAIKNNIRKITMISGATVREENAWYAPTKSKLMAEKSIQDSGIPYVIFRPSWFMESLPLMARNGKAMIIGKNPHKYPWIAASDYAQLVSKAMMTSLADNQILPIAGPEQYTIEEAINLYCERLDSKPKTSQISISAMRVMGFVTFNSQIKRLVSMFSYFEKATENNDASLTSKLLGSPKTTLKEWISKK